MIWSLYAICLYAFVCIVAPVVSFMNYNHIFCTTTSSSIDHKKSMKSNKSMTLSSSVARMMSEFNDKNNEKDKQNAYEELINMDVETLSKDPEAMFLKLRSLLKGSCVSFVGMTGCGKSSIGDAFAKNMNYRYLDTDEIAEYMIEMPISTFFSLEEGNVNKFRELEQSILQELSQYTRVVISTGGGIVERNENWGYLQHGIVVFLDKSYQDIYDRLISIPGQIEKRPLLSNNNSPLEKLQELSEKRREKYELADVTIKIMNNIDTPNDISKQVAKEILQFMKLNPPLWQKWTNRRKTSVEELAAQASDREPTHGFGTKEKKKGSIKYVSMDDIRSGKVKLPNANMKDVDISQMDDNIPEGLPKSN